MEQKLSFPLPTYDHKMRLNFAERMAVLIAGDIFLLFVSITIALWAWEWYDKLKFPGQGSLEEFPDLWWLVLPWLAISIITDSYNSNNLRQLSQGIKQPLRTTMLVTMIYIVLYFFAPKDTLPRFVIVAFGCLSCILLILWRVLHFAIFSNTKLKYRLCIVGDDAGIKEVQRLVALDPLHYEILGTMPSEEIIQSCPNILAHLDSIILASDHNLSGDAFQFVVQCREIGIPIIPLPIFYETLMKRTPISFMHGWYLTFLPFQDREWSGFYPLIKRIVDLVCALLGMLVLILIFPFLAIAIKLTSPGPIFFSQVRVGKNGQLFRIWKFRTMVVNAENKGPIWTENRDARITPLGNIIRKLHLDELPQIWHLLKGDVSVVGVRPITVPQCEEFYQHIQFHNLRHLVKPGLTSWAVVNYKHVNDMAGAMIRLEYDLYYVKHQSLWLDLLIILRTFWTMVTLNGL